MGLSRAILQLFAREMPSINGKFATRLGSDRLPTPIGGRSEVITRPLRFGSLLLTGALAACASPPHKFPVAPPVAVAPSTTSTRPLVEAPPPAELPDTPTPALKPGTDDGSTSTGAASGDT